MRYGQYIYSSPKHARKVKSDWEKEQGYATTAQVIILAALIIFSVFCIAVYLKTGGIR